MRSPFSKTYVIKCPDGTTRIIYKNVDKAFPLCIPGWQGKMGATIEAVKGEPANLNAEYQTQIQGLLYSLDELNQSLMMTFRAAYVSYQSNPCQNTASFNRQIEKIIDEHNRLTSLRIQIRGLIALAENNPNHPEYIIPVFKNLVDQLGGLSVSAAASIEIKETRAQAQKWIGGQHGG